jgi:melibiase-like protein
MIRNSYVLLIRFIVLVPLFSLSVVQIKAVEPVTRIEGKWQLDNSILRIAWKASEGVFRLSRREGTEFAQMRFDGQPKQIQYETWRHDALGTGQAIEVSLADGGTGRIILLPELPFVLLQKTMINQKPEDRMVDHIRPYTLTLDLAEPVSELKALGTTGLTAPDGHPGSYSFLAVAGSKSRRGVVSGWLSHDRGSGVVFSKIEKDQVILELQIDYGNLRIRSKSKTDSEIFAVGIFEDARLGLEAYADAIARYYQIRLRPIQTGYCTWYSNPHGGASDEKHIVELAEAAAQKLKPYGFDFIQIDDKWQLGKRRNGPAKNFYTHHPKGPYPQGMKKAADAIYSVGLVPGIWFMPFAGDREDSFFKEHLDWFVKRKDGTPYWARWGGTSLDMTNPDTQAYVRSIVHRIAHDWGYSYFKMDGLWTGTATKLLYVNNKYVADDIGEPIFHNPDKTPIEAYRDGLKLVRDAAGPDVFFLGCNVSQNMRSFGGSFGLLDAMRIGPDNGTNWKSLCRGPWHGTNRYFLHGRVWYNDPDPIYVREKMPLAHARLICSWVALTGQLNVFSEWLSGLPEERVDLLRRTMPNHGLQPRPVDLFENELAKIWLLTDTRRKPRRDVIGLFNWKEKETDEINCSLSRIGLTPAKRYVGYDYWADRFVPAFADRLQCTLEPGSCRVLAVRPESDHPQLISTSRHITQGIVDVLEEKWDAGDLTLHGRSKIVGGDPYELRIVVPAKPKYVLSDVTLSPKQGDELISPQWKQDSTGLRIQFQLEKNQIINWNVRFKVIGK